MTQRLTMVGLALCTALLLSLACRPDPGVPHYDQQEDFSNLGQPVEDASLPGPDPYELGELRYSLGVFYEGGFSDSIPVDGQSGNYYIYVLEADQGALTYAQMPEGDHVEGLTADRIIYSGHGWWGGGSG